MRTMSVTALTVICLFAAPISLAQDSLQNPDFEQGEVGKLPQGWFTPTAGYTAVTVEDRPHGGKRCARLSSDQGENQGPFGNIMQSFDATPYRGKQIRLRAAVRVAIGGFDDKAQLWLRVDRPGGQPGFFDNMGDRPIRDPDWAYYEIVGNVAEDAESINLGLMLIRNGQAWLDDVSLKILGDAPVEAAEGPRPLEGRALENLVAFTRLLSYVRFFHPSDQAAEANWDEFAIAGVREVEAASDPADLARRLRELFRPIAPTVRVFRTGEHPGTPAGLSAPAGESPEITTWRHFGVGLGNKQSTYRSSRRRETAEGGEIPEGMPNPAEPFTADLGGGVSCLVPLALWCDDGGTFPRPERKENADAGVPIVSHTGNDRGTRLADVALAWGVFQHFYPYFDVVETDWPAALRTALTAAATDADEQAFLYTLRRLVADLHDGHGGVYGPDTRNASLPLLWCWVEDHLVITAVGEAAKPTGLKPGDVVLKIDDQEPAAALADVEQYISAATPQWKRGRGLRDLARGTLGEVATLEIKDQNDEERSVQLTRVMAEEPLKEQRPEKVAELRPGIMYADIDRMTDDDFKQALPQLAKADGVVFDLRGYPSKMSTIVIAHLIDEPVTCAQWRVPKVTKPDREGMDFHFSNWQVQPEKPRLKGKVAFVTDGRAISYAETYLGIIEHYRLAEIVGGPTAGTNGNINPFTLPGGYQVYWTGMRVLKHDGSQHHGIGIIPTVPVKRTIQGIREGRDELLEKAIEVVSP